jgi:hypothetical protein
MMRMRLFVWRMHWIAYRKINRRILTIKQAHAKVSAIQIQLDTYS